MSCEVIEKIGTGDCELNKNCRSDTKIVNTLVTELVVEILENALDIAEENKKKSAKVGGDIMDNLSNKFQEMKLTENVIVSDVPKTDHPLKGLGDQLKPDNSSEEATIKHPPVEKKNRLTDLVKNSKQILSKFLLTENKGVDEEYEEKVIKVVDLDSGDPPFKVQNSSFSEEIIRNRNDESKMEEIDLQTTSDKTTETASESMKKTMTFPLATSSGGKTSSLMARYRTFKFSGELKPKKWNFGSKIMKIIRKKQTKRDTEDEAKGSDGIEISPKVDS